MKKLENLYFALAMLTIIVVIVTGFQIEPARIAEIREAKEIGRDWARTLNDTGAYRLDGEEGSCEVDKHDTSRIYCEVNGWSMSFSR